MRVHLAQIAVLAVVVSVFLSGCFDDTRARCDTGEVCPGSMVCASNRGGCVLPEQLERCSGADDGEPCQYAGNPSAVCRDQVCRGTECGNAFVEPGEQCDDGNHVSGDGCSASCTSTERCGNGVIDNGEDCDCGDGSVTTPDLCQGINDDRQGTCNAFCQLNCGDAMLDDGEACDLGVVVSDGESRPTCASFGFDRGKLRCSGLCGVDTSPCERLGWRTIGVGLFGTGVSFFDPPTRVLTAWVGPDGTMTFVADSGHTASRRPGEPSVIGFIGAPMAAISGTPTGALFAVGAGGRIFEKNPTWVPHTSPTTADLHGVWAASTSDVHVVGDGGTIAHFDGLFWSTPPVPTAAVLRAVHGASAIEGYAVGDGGTIVRYDGVAWTVDPSGTTVDLHAVWLAGGVPFAAGANGTILRRDSVGWTALATGTTATLRTVWGLRPDDVLAGGDGGELMHFDGQRWRRIETDVQLDLVAIRGDDTGVVVAAGSDVEVALTYAGSMWFSDPTPTAADLHDVAAVPGGGFVAVGKSGAIIRQDELGWTSVPSPVTADLYGVWAHDAGSIVAVGDAGTIVTLESGVWTASTPNPSIDFRAIWGAGPDDLFAVGSREGTIGAGGREGVIYHFDGASWSSHASGTPALWLDVWGTSGDQVIAVGGTPDPLARGVIMRYDGTTWTEDLTRPGTGGSVDAVWGSAADQVFFAARSGDLLRHDGVGWSTVGRGAPGTSLSGTVDTDVFVAGPRATLFDPVSSAPIFHYDGTYAGPTFLSSLSFVNSQTTADLHAVAATATATVFVGAGGTIRTLIRSTPWSATP